MNKKGGYSGSKPASSVPSPPKTPRAPKARVLKNDEFFKIGGDRTVTVSITFDTSARANEGEILINAAEAIKFYRDNKVHKSWTRKIEVK